MIREELILWLKKTGIRLVQILPSGARAHLRRIWLRFGLEEFTPRHMCSWYIESSDMHTRVVLCNLDFPGQPAQIEQVSVTITMWMSDGSVMGRVSRSVGRNQTLIFEAKELIGDKNGTTAHGLISLDVRSRYYASLRAYTQWYTESSVTGTHEKNRFVGVPEGFYALSRITADDGYNVRFAIVNLGSQTEQLRFCVQNHRGMSLHTSSPIPLRQRAALFVSLEELIPDLQDFLEGHPGAIHIENFDAPLIVYYFSEGKEPGTWIAQHL